MLQSSDGQESHLVPHKRYKYFAHKHKHGSMPDIWTQPKVHKPDRSSLSEDPQLRRLQIIMRFQSIAYALQQRHYHNNESDQHELQLMTALMQKIQTQRATIRLNSYHWARTVRFALFKCMSDPKSSWLAAFLNMIISTATLISVSVTCAETAMNAQDGLLYAELICTLIFTWEFLARFLACATIKEFLTWLTLIDVITIGPSYIELSLTIFFKDNQIADAMEFRVLRALRVLRIFKIARHLSWVPMIKEVLRESWLPLAMMGFIVGIILVVLSSIMYFIEKDSPDSLFISIPTTMYWCMITLTTVGYGDIVPVTPLGKFFAACTSIIGILLLAIPISIISDSFSTLYSRRQELGVFVETYRKRSESLHRSPSHEDKLEWIIHIAHEITSFSVIHKMNQQMQLDDVEADVSIRKFFAGSLAEDDDVAVAR